MGGREVVSRTISQLEGLDLWLKVRVYAGSEGISKRCLPGVACCRTHNE